MPSISGSLDPLTIKITQRPDAQHVVQNSMQAVNKLHESAIIYYRGNPVGTVAAQDPSV